MSKCSFCDNPCGNSHCAFSEKPNNIKLVKGVTYSNNRSDLAFKVIKVQYFNEEYVKVKGTLIQKYNKMPIERTKNYKLYFKNINDWERIENA